MTTEAPSRAMAIIGAGVIGLSWARLARSTGAAMIVRTHQTAGRRVIQP